MIVKQQVSRWRLKSPLLLQCPSLVSKDSAVWMVVLPVEPIILQGKDPREALPLHLTRNGATVEGPPADCGVIYERPGITRVRGAVAVELKYSAGDLSGKHAHGLSIWTEHQHNRLVTQNIEHYWRLDRQLA